MTTPAPKTTPERLREIRNYAQRIACESASDRWLRAAVMELCSALLGDNVRHEDIALSGAWDEPPMIPVPIDASSRGAQQMRLQQPAQPSQPMRLQPARQPPQQPAQATAAAPAAGGAGMSIEQAVALSNERRARLAAAIAAEAQPAAISTAPSNDPPVAASPAISAPLAPVIPLHEPAPDPTVPDPAGPDFLARLAADVAAEDQRNENT